MFEGQLVRLRAVTRDDLPRYVRWIADPDVTRFLNFFRPISLEQEERWFESTIAHESQHVFAIETLAGEHIGGVGLHSIHPRYRHAEVGIFIGEKEYWGRGYGSEALQLMLAFAFEQLNLNRVYLHVFAYNERAIAAYQKCGFVREGVLRQAVYKNGEYADALVMAILRDEYLRIHKGEH